MGHTIHRTHGIPDLAIIVRILPPAGRQNDGLVGLVAFGLILSSFAGDMLSH